MFADQKIFLDLSDEFRSFLEDEDLSLGDILQEEGVSAEINIEALPSDTPGERTRDLVPTILVGSIGAISLAAAIAMLLNAIGRYRSRVAALSRFVEYEEEEVIRDAEGNPLKDANGNILTLPRKVRKFVESEKALKESNEVNVGWARITIKNNQSNSA